MSNQIEVVSVNISREKGTTKESVPGIEVDSFGVVGDAHAGAWHRQVSLLDYESIVRFQSQHGISVSSGSFAENITLKGFDFCGASLLDRFRIGDVELEVTQIGKACHGSGCAIFNQVGECIMPKEGLFCRVLSCGSIKPGDVVRYLPNTLRFKIVTLSDRAFSGQYTDKSGPLVRGILEEHFAGKRWKVQMDNILIADDEERFWEVLEDSQEDGIDVLISTGSTGVGPRDIAPDVVTDFCEKLIPGIMDHIRLKCGADSPNSLISRSLAGVSGKMLVFALPGSMKAVREYLDEILTLLEHLLLMVRGIDAH